MKTCEWLINGSEPCGKLCEGKNALCATHAREARKIATDAEKESVKRDMALQKAKIKSSQPRQKAISKNPKDWNNTFLCSDGTRVTQASIDSKLKRHYSEYSDRPFLCEGCGKTSLFRGVMMTHAHIIPQSRCKQLGKTEWIWLRENWFYGCTECNLAIENPKGKEWKKLKNIEKCLSFIKQHDHELYMKFQLSAVNQEKILI